MLRSELEARVSAVESRVSDAAIRIDALCDSIDETCDSISDGDTDAIPLEALEADSVVNHMIDLRQTARRVRRESAQIPAPITVRDRRGR